MLLISIKMTKDIWTAITMLYHWLCIFLHGLTSKNLKKKIFFHKYCFRLQLKKNFTQKIYHTWICFFLLNQMMMRGIMSTIWWNGLWLKQGYNIKLNLMVRFQFWISRQCGILFHYHYSQVYSVPEGQHLIMSKLGVKNRNIPERLLEQLQRNKERRKEKEESKEGKNERNKRRWKKKKKEGIKKKKE